MLLHSVAFQRECFRGRESGIGVEFICCFCWPDRQFGVHNPFPNGFPVGEYRDSSSLVFFLFKHSGLNLFQQIWLEFLLLIRNELESWIWKGQNYYPGWQEWFSGLLITLFTCKQFTTHRKRNVLPHELSNFSYLQFSNNDKVSLLLLKATVSGNWKVLYLYDGSYITIFISACNIFRFKTNVFTCTPDRTKPTFFSSLER